MVGWLSWLLNFDQPAAAAPARHSCAPPLGAGSRRKAHGSEQRRQGSDAGLDAALRRGIDHEESRAAAAAVPGTDSRTRREEAITIVLLNRKLARKELAIFTLVEPE